jgi:hypothetical protein
MIAVQPAPHGINSSLVKHREELNLELLVVPDVNSQKEIYPKPIYRFKIKAQGVLIRTDEASKNSTGEASGG